jgi:p24 family protein alpha
MGLELFYILITGCMSIHFYIKEGSEKCFILDLPESTVVLGNYNLIDTPPPDQLTEGVTLRVLDTNSAEILTRLVTGAGKFSFTSQSFGQHKICLIAPSTGWFSTAKKLRFELRLDNTKDEVNHDHLASKEQLGHLEEIVNNINERLTEVIKQQEYSREKEAIFKDESEDINSRIMFFTIFQTIIILVSGIWQIWSLRRFFISRKLI